MYYSELVKKACLISFEAHKDDKDKGGYPYVYHPFFLASRFDDEETVCVALLHDVIEDHGDTYSFASFKESGFPDSVINALKLLTHSEGVPYMDYVKEIAKDPIARRVKMADLEHNMDSRRTNGKLPQKIETYQAAYEYLKNLTDFL